MSFRDEQLPYSDEYFDDICTRIMSGENIIDICSGKNKPCHLKTFYRWISENPTAKDKYNFAMEVRSHVEVEESIKIADGLQPREVKYIDEDGNEKTKIVTPGPNEVKRDELRIKTRQFRASKLFSRVYGEKQQIDMNVQGEIKHTLHDLISRDTDAMKVIDVEVKPVEEGTKALPDMSGEREILDLEGQIEEKSNEAEEIRVGSKT
jgi:hypothetical protein